MCATVQKIQNYLIEYLYTLTNQANFFTELLSPTTQQTNTIFIDNVFYCIGYEDHLTNGGCTNETVLMCSSRRGARLQCYNSKNYEQIFMTYFANNIILINFD